MQNTCTSTHMNKCIHAHTYAHQYTHACTHTRIHTPHTHTHTHTRTHTHTHTNSTSQGVKEVTLLGQNVNSYRDLSQSTVPLTHPTSTHLSRGFRTIYKPKEGGRRFADLLDKVAQVSSWLEWCVSMCINMHMTVFVY